MPRPKKTKNLSNKGKERAFVTGTIVKMLVHLMKQLEKINRGTVWRAHEERRKRAKEKK